MKLHETDIMEVFQPIQARPLIWSLACDTTQFIYRAGTIQIQTQDGQPGQHPCHSCCHRLYPAVGVVSALHLPEDEQVLVHGRLIVCAAYSAVAHQHWQLFPATVDPDRAGVYVGF